MELYNETGNESESFFAEDNAQVESQSSGYEQQSHQQQHSTPAQQQQSSQVNYEAQYQKLLSENQQLKNQVNQVYQTLGGQPQGAAQYADPNQAHLQNIVKDPQGWVNQTQQQILNNVATQLEAKAAVDRAKLANPDLEPFQAYIGVEAENIYNQYAQKVQAGQAQMPSYDTIMNEAIQSFRQKMPGIGAQGRAVVSTTNHSLATQPVNPVQGQGDGSQQLLGKSAGDIANMSLADFEKFEAEVKRTYF